MWITLPARVGQESRTKATRVNLDRVGDFYQQGEIINMRIDGQSTQFRFESSAQAARACAQIDDLIGVRPLDLTGDDA